LHTAPGDSNLTVLSVQGEGSGDSTPTPLGLLAIDDIGDKARNGQVAFCPTSFVGVLVERAQQIAIAAGQEVEYSVESLSIIPIAFLVDASEGPVPTPVELATWKESPLMLDLAISIWAQLRTVVAFQRDTVDSQLFPARASSVPESAGFRARFPAHRTAMNHAFLLGGILENPAGGAPPAPLAAQPAAATPQENPLTESLAIAQLALAQAKGAEYEMKKTLRTYNPALRASISLLLGPVVLTSPFFLRAFAASEMKSGKSAMVLRQFIFPLLATSKSRNAWPRSLHSFTLPPGFDECAEAGVFTADVLIPPKEGRCRDASEFINSVIPLLLLSEFFFGAENLFSIWLQTFVVTADNTYRLPSVLITQLDAGSFWDNLLVEIRLELSSAYGETLSALVSDAVEMRPALSTAFLTAGASYSEVYSANQSTVGFTITSVISLFLYHDQIGAPPHIFGVAPPWQAMVGPPRLSSPPPASPLGAAGSPASSSPRPPSTPKEGVKVISPWGPIAASDRASIKAGRALHQSLAKALGQRPPWTCVRFLASGVCHDRCNLHHHGMEDLPTVEVVSAYTSGELSKGRIQGMQRRDAASATVLVPTSSTPPCSASACKLCMGA
jgi:hypothetical protein